MILGGCKNRKNYVPEGLRKLTPDELMQRARIRDFPDPEKVVYKWNDGKQVPDDEVPYLDFVKYTTDPYVDESGEVIELVLRLATDADRILYRQLQSAYEEGPPLKVRDIDCNNLPALLQQIYDEKQDLPANDEIARDQQRNHLETVLSIGTNCGMPTLQIVTQQQMSSFWLTIQKASYQYRKAFLPNLVQAVERGDIEEKNIAMIKDKIAMDEGRPQIYGTQIFKNNETDEWVLYPVEEPEYVDRRRKDIGFGPLKEYLAEYNIPFEVEQF